MARVPVRLELKLVVAFLGAVGLLVLLGLAGLALLSGAAKRTEMLIKTEQRIDQYHHLEHHGHDLMITIASALWMPGATIKEVDADIAHLRQNLTEMRPTSDGEAAQIEALRHEYENFFGIGSRELALLRAGNIDQAGALQIDEGQPAMEKLAQMTSDLVDKAEADMEEAAAASREAYRKALHLLTAFVIAAAVLGIYLAHTISSFVVVPLYEIGGRLAQIAGGEFSQRIVLPNRDEIGALAENVNSASAQLNQLYTDLEVEKERSETMLYQILPRRIVQRMNAGETLIADRVTEATILFSDVVGFTELSDHLAPEEVVDVLDVLFSRYDALTDRLGLEKIKTIGDAYMVAAGVLEPRADHAAAIAEMALAMRSATEIATRALGVIGRPLQVRIGMHSGALIAGVLGSSKFVYDVWGDTVNTASRMEHYSETGRIAVTTATRDLLGSRYRFEARELIEIKGKGAMETFFLERRIRAVDASQQGEAARGRQRQRLAGRHRPYRDILRQQHPVLAIGVEIAAARLRTLAAAPVEIAAQRADDAVASVLGDDEALHLDRPVFVVRIKP